MTTSTTLLRRRTAAIGATAALTLTLLPATGHALPWDGWCSTADAMEAGLACIVSASRNGLPVTNTDPNYSLMIAETVVGGTWQVNWLVQSRTTGLELGPAELGADWQVTVNTRTHAPRFSFAHSTPGPVTRSVVGGENHITVSGRPVPVTQGCDGAGVCPGVATSGWAAYLDGWVYDADWYASTGVPADAWDGSNMWTNIDWTSFPPEVVGDDLVIRIANSHFRPDGVTEVRGFLAQELPFPLVRTVLGVDDPSTLAGSGVIAALSGSGAGTITVAVDPVTETVGVGVADVSFSRRTVRISAGVVTPRRTTITSARRSHGKVRVRFESGIARGSRITGYTARCYRAVGGKRTDVVKASGTGADRTRLVLRTVSRSADKCQVRVNSGAGASKWSRSARIR